MGMGRSLKPVVGTRQRPRTYGTPSLTYLRFSSRMELRMKVGFRAREMCIRSCSSVGHRVVWATARQVPPPAPGF